jgi:uncharacterized protein YcfJ
MDAELRGYLDAVCVLLSMVFGGLVGLLLGTGRATAVGWTVVGALVGTLVWQYVVGSATVEGDPESAD